MCDQASPELESQLSSQKTKRSGFHLSPRLGYVFLVLVLSCFIGVTLFRKPWQMKRKPVPGSLEFIPAHKGFDETDVSYQLKKIDPFIEGFVPKDYTEYLAKRPDELIEKKSYGKRHSRATEPDEEDAYAAATSYYLKFLRHPNSIPLSNPEDVEQNNQGANKTKNPDQIEVTGNEVPLDQPEESKTDEMESEEDNEIPVDENLEKSHQISDDKRLFSEISSTSETSSTSTTEPTTTNTRDTHKITRDRILAALNETSRDPESREELLRLLSAMPITSADTGNITLAPPPEIAKIKYPLGCRNITQFKITPNDSPQVIREKQGYLMRCYMDEGMDPCDRFYEYACGRWNGYHPIQRDRIASDIFEILREDIDSKLIQILESPIDEMDSESTVAVKTLFSSCMNTEVIKERREKPLKTFLRELGGWPVVDGEKWNADGFDWQKTITRLRGYNNDILILLWVGPDGKDSNDYIVQFDQGDPTLPSPEYYSLGMGHPILHSYYHQLVNVSVMLGADRSRAEFEMKQLIEFETNLTKILIPPRERRNYSEIYHKVELGKLAAEVPDFDFVGYLDHLLPRSLNATEEVIIFGLAYFKSLTQLISRTPKRVTANYILWRFIRHRINNLDHRFIEVQHDLFMKLTGREDIIPRKKFCVTYVNGNLGNAVGSLFVKKYFDGQSKVDMEGLTNRVQSAFLQSLMSGAWLSNHTKKLAESKLNAIVQNIGFPDFILDDKALHEEGFGYGITFKAHEYFENVLKLLRARTAREMNQLDHRVDRTQWTATPAVVNAYYSRNRNQITFPAGILQPPFYHKHFPKSLNFGGIGVVIGHEITHGFDDKGRQFDHTGNINQWWDHSSSTQFQERAQCIIDQYSQIKIEEIGFYLNGMVTQGENIADHGGVKQAYNAYQGWLAENDLKSEDPLPGLEHLSDSQLFFLNYAQVWCGATRPEALRSKVKTAVHPPGKYRVFGTLMNSEDFSKAFNCPKGSRMNMEPKCSVW